MLGRARWLAPAVLIIAGLGTAIAFDGAHASPTAVAVEIRCKAPGLQYLGRTGQGKAVCFTVSRDRRTVREFAFGVRLRCSSSTSQASVKYEPEPYQGAVTQGAFAVTVDLGARISFRGSLLGARRAAGTLKLVDPSCRPLTAGWSARRSP